MFAIEAGWQVVADQIKSNNTPNIPAHLLELHTAEEIIE